MFIYPVVLRLYTRCRCFRRHSDR